MINIKRAISCLYIGISAAIAMEDTENEVKAITFNGKATCCKDLTFDLRLDEESHTVTINGVSPNHELLNPKEGIKKISLTIPGSIQTSSGDKLSVSIGEQAFKNLNSEYLNLSLVFSNVKFPKNCRWLFHRSESIVSIALYNKGSTNVKNMQGMFEGCSKLKSIIFNCFDTSGVTDMSWLFDGCTSLENLNLSEFDTSKVTTMECMFRNCNNLKNITFGELFCTENVTTMGWMFNNCYKLGNLDLGNFDTGNVDTMVRMFHDCSALKWINFGKSFDTKKVKDMSYMFSDCRSIEQLDLTDFDTENVKCMRCMFADCANLKKLVLGKQFYKNKIGNSSDMFTGCNTNLNVTIKQTSNK